MEYSLPTTHTTTIAAHPKDVLRAAGQPQHGCSWSLVGLLIAVRGGAAAASSTMAGTRSLVGLLISVRGAATAGSTMAVTSAHPAGRRRLTYEYAPTADATPYCRLQNPSVCWGNTHRFLYVMANGPFEGINASLTSSPNPALGDLDGDGALRPRPSIDKLPSHLCRSQATWTS